MLNREKNRNVTLIGKDKHFIYNEFFQFTGKLLKNKQYSKFEIVMTLCHYVIFIGIFDGISGIMSKSQVNIRKNWAKLQKRGKKGLRKNLEENEEK